MDSTTKVSIIILNWNTLSYLKKCVSSIKKYTTNYEIIIFDNGSIEKGTQDYIKSVTNKYFFNPVNIGFSKGNNFAATLADPNSDYLCFLNSDTIVSKNWLEDMYSIFDDNKKTGAVGPLGNPKIGSINGNYYNFRQFKGMYKVNTKVNKLVGFCILVKKEVFNLINGWDEEFKIGTYEDDYLSEQIKNNGYELWISVKSKVYHFNPGRSIEANNVDFVKVMEENGKVYKNKIGEKDGR